MLWFLLLAIVPFSLYRAAQRGVPLSGIRILLFAAVLGAVLGLLGSGAILWWVDEPWDRWILFSLIPVTAALLLHGLAILGIHFWTRYRLRVQRRQPPRRLAAGRDVKFDSDADLARALDDLEETMNVKYIPNRLVETDHPWAYEAWSEVLEDPAPTSTYLLVPARARLRLSGSGPGAMRQIEPRNTAAVVVIVPSRMTGKGAAAIATSDGDFCTNVLHHLDTGWE